LRPCPLVPIDYFFFLFVETCPTSKGIATLVWKEAKRFKKFPNVETCPTSKGIATLHSSSSYPPPVFFVETCPTSKGIATMWPESRPLKK